VIGIIDYGRGNLRSVQNALHEIGAECMIADKAEDLENCSKLILPGVGAFGDCMNNIRSSGLETALRELALVKKKPLLGICLGMQMLFERSEEKGDHAGFGFLKGNVVRMQTDLPVPQIGWNELEWYGEPELQKRLSPHPCVYYVHSYCAQDLDEEDLAAASMYGDIRVTGIVRRGNIMGCQFHPEKSGPDGLEILKYFLEVVE
jgi:glutamine amidotransferase